MDTRTWRGVRRAALLAAGLTLGACGADAPPVSSYDGPTITVNAAPLTLSGIDDGCYTLTVATEGGTVWKQEHLCGHQYGQDAAISYVGPCDATGGTHTVTLELEGLCAGDCGTWTAGVGDAAGSWSNDTGDYQNPCPLGTGCKREDVACTANGDTPVQFDITFAREAHQGFFDIAVNFNNIFCSAKVDCAYAGSDPEDPSDDETIKLLFNGGSRDRTAVIGFACTAGVGGGKTTVLAMSDIEVTCDDEDGHSSSFSPDVDGNVVGNGSIGPDDVDTNVYNALYAAAVNRGSELLQSGSDGSANKVYWNILIGYKDIWDEDTRGDGEVAESIDDAGSGRCVVRFEATALDGANANASTPATPSGVTYPVITAQVLLTDLNGGRACTRNPLDMSQTVDLGSLEVFDNATGYMPDVVPEVVGVRYVNDAAGYDGHDGPGDGFTAYPAP